MTIPENLKGRYAYHFTHIANLASIIDAGILSTNSKKALGISHENVAEEGIQSRRSTMKVPCSPNKVVHDFVPFYFAKKTPMQLSVINKKNVDQPFLIYFAIPIEVVVNKEGVVFSDASANTETPPNFYNASEAEQLNSLNWKAIDDKKWGCPDENYRHQKMAELLIPERVDIGEISSIVVWNSAIKKEIERIFAMKNMQCPELRFDGDHYYTNFFDGGKKSVVTGPYFLRREFENTVKAICDYTSSTTRFDSVETILNSIIYDFCSIKELADIDGLQANYGPHKDDVGTHSRKVAAALDNVEEFNLLKEGDKNIVRLSAYLHDIGKGPRSRWGEKGMDRSDNDHAVKSLPMLKRILTEDVGGLDTVTVRKIVMLVTYDDLIGDIVAKGRDEKQLFDLIASENDLNMLVALGKADMTSINSAWVDLNKQQIEALKAGALSSLECASEC